MLLGVVIVLGACVALWWHHQQYKSVETDDEPDHALAFAQRQYNRRSITTTMIGVLGLLILATEISRSVWLNLFIMLAMTGLVMVIPLMALLDIQSTRRYYKKHDQGVRRATHDLLEELQRIEKTLHEKRDWRVKAKLRVPRPRRMRNPESPMLASWNDVRKQSWRSKDSPEFCFRLSELLHARAYERSSWLICWAIQFSRSSKSTGGKSLRSGRKRWAPLV